MCVGSARPDDATLGRRTRVIDRRLGRPSGARLLVVGCSWLRSSTPAGAARRSGWRPRPGWGVIAGFGASHRGRARSGGAGAGLPELAAAMGAGRLSYSQVRAILPARPLTATQAHRGPIDAAVNGTHRAAGDAGPRGLRTVRNGDSKAGTQKSMCRIPWSSQRRGECTRGSIRNMARSCRPPSRRSPPRRRIDPAAALAGWPRSRWPSSPTRKPLRGLRGDERASLSTSAAACRAAECLAAMARAPHAAPPSRVPLNAPLAIRRSHAGSSIGDERHPRKAAKIRTRAAGRRARAAGCRGAAVDLRRPDPHRRA